MNKNILLCGVGGQGTVLASKLIAAAAMHRGIDVRTAETIGMAQRGGSVFSHLRMGDDLNAPLIGPGRADLLIGFEPAEAVRMLPWLKKGGAAVVSTRPVMPVSALIGESSYPVEEILACLRRRVPRLTLVDADRAAADLGSSKVLNVVLLGAALRSGELGLNEEDLRSAIRERVPARFHELNERALQYTARAAAQT
ncbi:MAG: indolepyruvate oxidoreductase subunit beta [Anaerovoracaceae bacterium]|jgi:indolepyruvate ferredoxin oxidoreductase beta subunit